MYIFPSVKISVEDFTERRAFDPTYRSSFVSGHEVTRLRATWVPKEWHLKVRILTDEEKLELQTFEENVGFGGEIFAWFNVKESAVYHVRLAQLIEFNLEPKSNQLWRADVVLRQAENVVITEGEYGWGIYGEGTYGKA